jgi:hypothetical protein
MMDLPDRLAEKISPEPMSGCWLWTASIKRKDGYGRFRWDGKMKLAHRVVWSLLRSQIPGGLTIDHLCRNHACVNPDHMEVVTLKENLMRGIGPSAVHARKTHCIHGHELIGGNLFPNLWRRGKRHCIACTNRRGRERQARITRIK